MGAVCERPTIEGPVAVQPEVGVISVSLKDADRRCHIDRDWAVCPAACRGGYAPEVAIVGVPVQLVGWGAGANGGRHFLKLVSWIVVILRRRAAAALNDLPGDVSGGIKAKIRRPYGVVVAGRGAVTLRLVN